MQLFATIVRVTNKYIKKTCAIHQRRSIRNSELTVPKEKRKFLTYPADGLAPCILEEAEDGIELQFDTAGLEVAESVLNKLKEEQFRFLVNTSDLDKLSTEYEISLSPDNLLIDINLRPQVMIRDVKHNDSATFLSRYMALIGCVLHPRYKYDDYLSGGNDLYKKNKLLTKLAAHESVEEIKSSLILEHQTLINKIQKRKKLVPKVNVYISRAAIPALIITLLITSFFLWIAMFQDIPYKDDVIKANSAFIAGDYIETQRALSMHVLADLTFESKYLLSRAYVITEALTDMQKENILMGLAFKTDPIIFDYWILLGRLEIDEAIDIAQRLGDDELLLFAYLKQEVIVRNDTTMTGEEKTTQLNELSGKIDNLQKAREAAADEAENEAADESTEAN